MEYKWTALTNTAFGFCST